MARSRTLLLPLTLLGLFLLGTVVVLSTVSYYLAIDASAYLTDDEVPPSAGAVTANSSRALERIPRIIHQTWKTDTLPERWKAVSKTCTSIMPDYEYMLWTDASSRNFIAKEYPWFLATFDGYTYNIQRADAIRYFVLHHYGGVYLDLDVGCLRPLDPLLQFSVILPKTIPVGVSNDLMFSAKGHPFMEQTIHNLIPFDRNYFLNYPTVMFSTGPMYVSAQYGLYTASHPSRTPEDDVRILSKALYGKNAKPEEAPHSFFSHHYGSSWHADDAAFITFLGKWGQILMRVG
ncbi:glycosyltransferase family 32 protein, partial [Clavulina sp. PMI_390]